VSYSLSFFLSLPFFLTPLPLRLFFSLTSTAQLIDTLTCARWAYVAGTSAANTSDRTAERIRGSSLPSLSLSFTLATCLLASACASVHGKGQAVKKSFHNLFPSFFSFFLTKQGPPPR